MCVCVSSPNPSWLFLIWQDEGFHGPEDRDDATKSGAEPSQNCGSSFYYRE